MKHTFALLPIVLLFGCGPSTPAESPGTATTATPAAPATTAEAKPADTAAPTAAPTATAVAETKPAEPPPPAPPNVTGTLAGKEFKPKAAITMGPLFQGRVLIALADYDAACNKAYEPNDGDRTVGMSIEWKQGDVAFAGGKDKKGPLPPFYTLAKKGTSKVTSKPFNATGKVELSAAPTEVGKSARLKVDLTSGKDTLKGDIELFVCWDIKEAPKK